MVCFSALPKCCNKISVEVLLITIKTTTIVCTLIAIGAVTAGCSHANGRSGGSIGSPVATTQTPAVSKTGPVRWTLETEVPDDPEKRSADIGRHMAKFARKGLVGVGHHL